MKVYIVSEQDYEQYDILGVYENEVDAEIRKREESKRLKDYYTKMNRPWYSASINLDSYEVIH